jgi:pimeloyl-ACP methyl ester carboxylesterase
MSRGDAGPVVHNALRVNGITMHYVRAGEGPPLVLLHGWGSTWFMWRKLIGELAEHFTVIAPDLRGIGDSSKPVAGYDKLNIARDVHALVEELELGPIRLVGHDWGGPVAYLYAAGLRAPVHRLAMLETLVFGVEFEFDIRLSGELWHNAFHAVADLPEALVAGRERTYLSYFYERNAYDPSAIEPGAVDEYVRCYSGLGAMRAGFAWYRTMEQDLADMQEAARTALTIPVLALGGDASLGETPGNAMRAVAEDVESDVLERCGHWMPEERPAETCERLRAFMTADLTSLEGVT